MITIPTAAEASESAPLKSLVDSKAELYFEPQEAIVDSAEPELSAAADVPASSTDPLPEVEEEAVPPPPTSPFLAAVGVAEEAPTSGHVQTGHSPSAPSRPPRVRGTKGGRHKRTSDLIRLWQSLTHLQIGFSKRLDSISTISSTVTLVQS